MRFWRRLPVCFFILFLQFVCAQELTPSLTVDVPMRDGVELPTDLYLPKLRDPTSKAPCVLLRSPGGRNAKAARAYLPLVQAGYVVAIQDTRSSMDQEGKTLPYWTDGWGNQQDGYDAVEWLANCEYTNGKIGTAGPSALGITQLLMAPTAPPSLCCQYICMAAASLYHDAIFPGGQLLKNQVEGWLGLYAKAPEVRDFVCTQPCYNAFWTRFDTGLVADRVKAPGLHYGGWYDIFVQGTLDAFVSRQENGAEGARGQQKLLIGPWSHFWPTTMKLGDYEVPVQGRTPPVDLTSKKWFDYYLKGEKNGLDQIPAVTYYVMGTFDGSPSSGNVWRHADRWPVPAIETAYFFTADRRLMVEMPKAEATFAFQFDPRNPVPTVGGNNLFLESGPKDQKPVEQREDVLVFTSDTLPEDMEVTGRIFGKLFFSSDQSQADVVVRICDVYPDEKSILIVDGARHINNEEGGKIHPQEVDIDLWSTSIVFAKGHRIRVSITSSNYPKYEKNDSSAIANNTVHVGGLQASYIKLPVVRKGETWVTNPIIQKQQTLTQK